MNRLVKDKLDSEGAYNLNNMSVLMARICTSCGAKSYKLALAGEYGGAPTHIVFTPNGNAWLIWLLKVNQKNSSAQEREYKRFKKLKQHVMIIHGIAEMSIFVAEVLEDPIKALDILTRFEGV